MRHAEFQLNRLTSSLIVLGVFLSHIAGAQEISAKPAPFVHPGLLHSAADLQRIQLKVANGQEPWKSGLAALRAVHESRADYRMRGPFAAVSRDPQRSEHDVEMVLDGNSAYQNALVWCVTGDEAHARKAVEVLDAWSATLTKMEGRDVQLAAGLDGFKFVSAAELMRATYPKWPADRIARCQRMLRDVVYPPIKDFAPFANGNWDGACIKTMMAIGVFCDDRAMFDRAVDYFRRGKGDGRLTNYILESGQCQESGRDQQHTQLGLGQLAEACEIAFHQGVDLYGEADNRLLKGFEYTARYNLGQDVPFTRLTDAIGKHTAGHISTEGRGELRPIYEMVLNHYVNRRSLEAPYTQKAAEKLRPEGAAVGADHPGFGTLLYYNTPKVPLKSP